LTRAFSIPQQLRQLGDVGGDAPDLVRVALAAPDGT
jgi:hypothetical protein